MIKRIERCKNNPEKPSTTKSGEHIPGVYSMSVTWKFDGTERKHDVYRGKNCMKKYYESLIESATKIVNSAKKKMIPLIKE